MTKTATHPGILLLSLLAVGCAQGGPSPEAHDRALPVSFAAQDGSVALAGHYDADAGVLVLDDAVLDTAALGGEQLRLAIGMESLVLDSGEANIELDTTLEVGDELTLSAGDISLALVVEEIGFEPDAAPEELAKSSSGGGCSLNGVQGVYTASWGCATQPVSGLPQDRLYWNIEDSRTDGYCVQLWAEYYNSGAWFRLDVSCGQVASGSVAKGTLADRVRTLRLFRTNTQSTVLYEVPGNYMTIYSN